LFGLLSAPVASAEDQPISVAGKLNAPVPNELRSLLIEDPYVLFYVDVGEDGTLFDLMAAESNHRDLIPAATKALMTAGLQPAQQDGQSIRSRASIKVRFFDPEQRAWQMGLTTHPFGSSPSDAADRRIYAVSKSSFVYGLSQVDVLDKPMPEQMPLRRIDAARSALQAKGRCVLEFFIDSTGKARFPEAVERDNDEVAMSAAVLLLRSYFTPPTRGGHPTYVRVRQAFEFL
jgi:hypothetical protein